jgi:hypothetical protein
MEVSEEQEDVSKNHLLDILKAQLRELFLPVQESLLILSEHFLVFFQLVAHFEFHATGLGKFC